jgi:hypothetical protein
MQDDAAQFMAQAFTAIGSIKAAAVSAQQEDVETPSVTGTVLKQFLRQMSNC